MSKVKLVRLWKLPKWKRWAWAASHFIGGRVFEFTFMWLWRGQGRQEVDE